MGPCFCDRLRLNFYALAWRGVYLTAGRAAMLAKKCLLSGNLAILIVLALKKGLSRCSWVPREVNSRFCSKTQWEMFLLVFGRHVGSSVASPYKSLQFWVKHFSASCLRQIALTWTLVRVFVYLPSFFSQILDFIFWTVLIYIFRSILNDMTLKTTKYVLISNQSRDGLIYFLLIMMWRGKWAIFLTRKLKTVLWSSKYFSYLWVAHFARCFVPFPYTLIAW